MSTITLSDHFNYRKLLRFTLPSIAMMIFTSIYSVVDGVFVSNFVGKTPFAAVNLIFFLHHQPSFSHHCRRAADEDVAIGLYACGDDRRAAHGLTLDEVALRFCAEAAALLQVVGQ